MTNETLFSDAVQEQARTVAEPFLIEDLRWRGRELTGPEKTQAFHIVRDMVDDGELRHDNTGYSRV